MCTPMLQHWGVLAPSQNIFSDRTKKGHQDMFLFGNDDLRGLIISFLRPYQGVVDYISGSIPESITRLR